MPENVREPLTAEATCAGGPFESATSRTTFTRDGKVVEAKPAAQP